MIDIQKIAREATLDEMWDLSPRFLGRLEKFAALCCAAQREKDEQAATEAVAFNGGSVQMEAHVRAAIRGQT